MVYAGKGQMSDGDGKYYAFTTAAKPANVDRMASRAIAPGKEKRFIAGSAKWDIDMTLEHRRPERSSDVFRIVD